jgi:hypothetical protein
MSAHGTSRYSAARRDNVVHAGAAAENSRVISRQPMDRFKASKSAPSPERDVAGSRNGSNFSPLRGLFVPGSEG